MRTGIISDVHGNLPALEAILDRLQRGGVDRILSLGDVVGYGAQPEACVRIVRDVASESCLGNHDAAISSRLGVRYAAAEGQRLVEHARGDLSRKSLRWLAQRPIRVAENDATYCHGAPPSPEEFRYVLSLRQARALLSCFDELPPVTFMGHSHLERSFRLWPGGVTELIAGRIRVDSGRRYVVNVGSVGQPRDRDPRAAAAIFDHRRGTVEFVREPYDVAAAASRIRAAGLPESFARRLFLAW